MEEESSCTLCNRKAVMQCDSDQAKLCWTCDEKVHSANFLVAKHSRTLLCSLCHSLTQWNASGPKLTPTLSLCHSSHRRGGLQRAARDGEEDDQDYNSDQEEGDDGEEDEDEDEEEDRGEGENQVVPMSSASSGSYFKRLRDDDDEDDDSFTIDSQLSGLFRN